MEEKILDEEEAELFGIKRKKQPAEEPLESQDEAEYAEEAFETQLEAKLDEGYIEGGYVVREEDPFEFSEAEEDDESLVMLSPEEALALVRKREEKARKDKERCENLKKEGAAALGKGDFEKARECFTQANEFDPSDLEINVGYMRAYSEDFTLLEEFETLREVYEQCYESAQAPFANRVKEQFGSLLEESLKQAEAEEEAKSASFMAAQESRREEFSARSNGQNLRLFKLSVPMVFCAIVAVLCACFINAVQGYLFVVLSVAFGAAAVILAIPTVLIAKKAAEAARLLRENERLDSTEEGRQLERLRDKIDFILECLK